jgi:hypothetical protein
MTINSPDALPGDEPEDAKGNGKDGGVPAGNDGVGLG